MDITIIIITAVISTTVSATITALIGHYKTSREMTETEIAERETKKQTLKAARQKKNRLAELKKLLETDDYKIIKCMEAKIVGTEMPYDYATLIATRNAYRAEINTLEAK